jgi:hypothetical protein
LATIKADTSPSRNLTPEQRNGVIAFQNEVNRAPEQYRGTSSTDYGEINKEGYLAATPEQLGYKPMPEATTAEKIAYKASLIPYQVTSFPGRLQENVKQAGGVANYGIQAAEQVGNVILTPVRGGLKLLSAGWESTFDVPAEQTWLGKLYEQKVYPAPVVGGLVKGFNEATTPKGEVLTDPDVTSTAFIGGLALIPGQAVPIIAAGGFTAVSGYETLTNPSPQNVGNLAVAGFALKSTYEASNLPKVKLEKFAPPVESTGTETVYDVSLEGFKPKIVSREVPAVSKKTLGLQLGIVRENIKSPEIVKPIVALNLEESPKLQKGVLTLAEEHPVTSKWEGSTRISEAIVSANVPKLAPKWSYQFVELPKTDAYGETGLGDGGFIGVTPEQQAGYFKEAAFATKLLRNQQAKVREDILTQGTEYLSPEAVKDILDTGRGYGAITFGSKASQSQFPDVVKSATGEELPAGIKLFRKPSDVDQYVLTSDIRQLESIAKENKYKLEQRGYKVRYDPTHPTKTVLEAYDPTTAAWNKVYEVKGRGQLAPTMIPNEVWGNKLSVELNPVKSKSGYTVSSLMKGQQRKLAASTYFNEGALSVKPERGKDVPDFLRDTAALLQSAKESPHQSGYYKQEDITRVETFLSNWPKDVGFEIPPEAVQVELSPAPAKPATGFGTSIWTIGEAYAIRKSVDAKSEVVVSPQQYTSSSPTKAPSLVPSPQQGYNSKSYQPAYTPTTYKQSYTAPTYKPEPYVAPYKPEPYVPPPYEPYTPLPYEPPYVPPPYSPYKPSYAPYSPEQYIPFPAAFPGFGLSLKEGESFSRPRKEKGRKYAYSPDLISAILDQKVYVKSIPALKGMYSGEERRFIYVVSSKPKRHIKTKNLPKKKQWWFNSKQAL